MGEAAGVAVDVNGHVMVFHRPGRGFDTAGDGPLEGSRGARDRSAIRPPDPIRGARTRSSCRTASPSISANNVFLTDVALQQVFKFSHDGKLLFAVGEPRVGKWDATHFNQPTDIAIRADGSFYVSDGYVNSRVAIFDSHGKWLREWGKKGAAAASSAIRTA